MVTNRLAFLAAIALATPATAPVRAWANPPGLAQAVEIWGASPQPAKDPVQPTTPFILNDETVREIVTTTAAGQAIRLRLTNEYTDGPTHLDDVHLAVSGNPNTSGIAAGTDNVVTFGGQRSVTVAANSVALSDPVYVTVPAGTNLAVSIHIVASGGYTTYHELGQRLGYFAAGDHTADASIPGGAITYGQYMLSGIEAYEPNGAVSLVALGDSLTDGYGSTFGTNHRWTDYLASRLQNSTLNYVAVSNQGISGNKLLTDGIGPSAQSRLDRDELSKPAFRYLVLLEGINDIGQGASAADVIAAYQQIVARTHARIGLVYGGTLPPIGGSNYDYGDVEAKRQAVNAFIRTSGLFDGVIDFDAAIRDPANPQRMRPAYDSGDHLHPGDAGYAAMANSIPLALFAR